MLLRGIWRRGPTVKNIWKWLFKKKRTLRVNVLTLFLALITTAFAFVISFTYSKNYSAILQSIQLDAGLVAELVLERFRGVALGSEKIAEIFSDYFESTGNLSVYNKNIEFFMLSSVKDVESFSDLYYGLCNGDAAEARNLSYYQQETFFSDPTKKLPPKTAFSFNREIRSSLPHLIYWYYFDDEFNILATETTPIYSFVPMERPWYQGAEQSGSLYWTGLYGFYPSGIKGISVSYPIYDTANNFVGAVGVDLTTTLISDFLREQKIGNSGKAFIVDSSGTIILPRRLTEESFPRGISEHNIKEIYQFTLTETQTEVVVFDAGGRPFIGYVAGLPVVFGHDWQIFIVAPLADFLGHLVKLQKEIALIIVGILILSALAIIYFSKRISSPIVTLAQEVYKIRNLDLHSELRVKSNIKEVIMMDEAIAAMRRVLRSFASYVPKEIVQDLMITGEEIALGGKAKEITIFFSDVAGFTAIAENQPIDVLVSLLAEYFDDLSKIILSSHGTIDKFIGDAIMAFWGAPIDMLDHAARACQTALKCKVHLIGFNQRRREKGLPEFPTRFGINKGTVIVGNMGTSERMNYTVIGDAVNITARLQEVDKIYHTSIIISEEVYEEVKDAFVARPLDIVTVKGKKEKIKIFELLGMKKGDAGILAKPEDIALSEVFNEAFEAYHGQDLAKAKTLFEQILERYPDDYPTRFYLDRLK